MTETIRRRILGVGALVLLATGAVLWFCSAGDNNRALGGMALKAGLAFGAAWLAFPQIMTLSAVSPPRLTCAVLAGALVLVFRPQYFRFVAALILILAIAEGVAWLFRPLPTGPPRSRRRPSRGDRLPP